ncbi:ADP ribosyltransferase [Bacillus thuringiensis]|uniref:ADP-ribosyltransferase certhrax n=1 Tax=Bacillus thuringiensis TaxID=1428 RepID=A0A9W3X427_BACTU|nr:ADP-ribosyltransferase [Bacillus thuringiensis]ANS51764.1 putative ADP-ribosyltransferase certhrax [Bacillus thuringiensis]MBH0338450.1 ADP ribosyltransferase [Bacillus thuringiensis]
MFKKNKRVLYACIVGASILSSLTIPMNTSAETTVGQQCHATAPRDFKSECKSEATDWGKEFFDLWNKLTPKVEKDAVRDYTGGGYYHINEYLRSGYFDVLDQEKTEKSIKQIDRAFSRVKLHDDMIVYRRVSESAFGLPENSLVKLDVKEDDPVNSTSKINTESFEHFKNSFQGKYKKDPAYMSTSIVKDAAKQFSLHPILMKIHVPKGVPAIYVDPLSNFPGEMELLLPRNRTYKVTNISPVIEKDKEYVMLDVAILDIESNYRNKRSTDIIYKDNLPSLSK